MNYSSFVRDACKASGCTRPVRARNYCDLHYQRFMKYGLEGVDGLIKKKCAGCQREMSLKAESARTKFCSKKCEKAYRDNLAKICKVEGCTSKAKIKKTQLCGMHQTRLNSHGDVETIKRIAKYQASAVCIIEGCSNKPLAKGMCNRHYIMMKVHGDPNGGAYVYKVRKAVTHEDGTRTCSECEIRQPISNFHKDKNATDGFRSKCKDCRGKLVKGWYEENIERQRKRANLRRKADPEKERIREAERYERDREKRIALATEHAHRRKARKLQTKVEKGISILSLKKLHGTKCYYCEKEMDFSKGVGRKFNQDMATIEHLVPLARGGEHTFENTVLACRFCNISRGAKSQEDFEEYRKNTD